MIASFRDKRTRDFANGVRIKTFQGFAAQAGKRLTILNVATDIRDLSALRSNRFEALKGDRIGQFSIRINEQWRICFEWQQGAPGPENVEIVDYH